MASAKIGVASPFTQSKKRTSSASVSECGSERSLRSQGSGLNRVKKGVSPGISEYQVSNLRTAQTQSAHEKWMWREFDKVMQGFADILRFEHKSVNLRNKDETDVLRDENPIRPWPPVQNVAHSHNNPMTPLYFRHGISDRIVFRF